MLILKTLTGKEVVASSNRTVQDFWKWAYSDVLSNRNRGIFAEFIVGSALGLIETPRIEWNDSDFLYRSKKLEVKSSGYLQNWHQDKLSQIKFGIEKTMGWNAETNKTSTKLQRQSDCYIFCLFAEKKRKKANVLNLHQWRFYVLTQGQIQENFGEQKSVSLNPLRKVTDSVPFEELRTTIDNVLSNKC